MAKVGLTEGLLATFIVFFAVFAGLMIGIAYNTGAESVDGKSRDNNYLYISTIVFAFITCMLSVATGWAISHPE